MTRPWTTPAAALTIRLTGKQEEAKAMEVEEGITPGGAVHLEVSADGMVRVLYRPTAPELLNPLLWHYDNSGTETDPLG